MYYIIVHNHSQEELLKQLKEKKAQEDEAKEKAKLQKAKKHRESNNHGEETDNQYRKC